MSLSASATPSSGGTPTTFTVAASGGVAPYTLVAAPSPPNPIPMPDYDITLRPGYTDQWIVEIKDPVAPDTDLEFTVADADQDSSTVVFTCT